MKHSIIKFLASSGSIFFCAALLSCSSVPTEIPEDLSAQQLIQLGQTAFESGKYKVALAYFSATAERYSHNPSVYVEASYEIAHVHMRSKNYAEAVPILQGICDLYPRTAPGVIPAAFLKLAQIELAKVPPHEMERIRNAQAERKEILQSEQSGR